MLLREIIQSLLINLLEYNGEKVSHLNDNKFYMTMKENKKIPSICYSKQKKEVVRKLILSILRINAKLHGIFYSPELQQEAGISGIYSILLNAREELGKLKNNMKGRCDFIIEKHIDQLNAAFLKQSQERVDPPQRGFLG